MRSLECLLHPRSIAIIGGGIWCRTAVNQCKKMGFSGEIWPIHPEGKPIAGIRSFRSIEDLPAPPDAAFVGVNRDAAIKVVQALSDKGAGGVVCFAAGFSESQAETGDGAAKQDALLAAAGDMRLIGPNCYGILNYLDGVGIWPDQQGGVAVDSGVAILAQSSNIAMNLTMQDRGLPIAYMVAAGNQAQTDMAEIAQTLLADKRVSALGLYIEGIKDLRRFEKLAMQARAAGKYIVALKVGKSRQAQAAAISHTASLAGSSAGSQALLRRLGIGQASSLEAFVETLKLFHMVGSLESNRIAVMACSGGEISLVADFIEDRDLEFAPLSAPQTHALRKALGANVALANPLDYHAYSWGNEESLKAAFSAMMQGDFSLASIILDFPRRDRCARTEWEAVMRAAISVKKTTQTPIAIVSTLKETLPEEIALELMAQNIIPLSGIPQAYEAIEIAAQMGQNSPPPLPLLLPPLGAAKHSRKDTRSRAANTQPLTEAEAKAAIADFGVCVPRFARAFSAEEAAEKAAHIGFPVVLKGQGIAHKTEAGAVALNLICADEVRAAARKMPANAFLIEEMIHGGDGAVELLIGVVLDPANGYVLTIAAGGILTEILADSASLLLPARREEIECALAGLRIGALLAGYRGRQKADMGAILDAIMALQKYVEKTLPQEVEINPLICHAKGAVAVDALSIP